MATADRRSPRSVRTGGACRWPAKRHDALQFEAFVDRQGAAARRADQDRCRLARYLDRNHRAPLWALYRAPRRRSNPRGAARHLAAEHARQGHHAAALIMAGALSDQAWADICAAAGRSPDDAGRAAMSALLYEEFPAFRYDRERWAKAAKRAERMLKYLVALAALYRETFVPQLPLDQFEAILAGRASAFVAAAVKSEQADDETEAARNIAAKTEYDLSCLARLRRRPEALWLTARAVRRANARRASAQHEWLYNQLCTVWLWDFLAPLTYSVPPRGGPPRGPLIAFILAAAGLVMSEPPSPETVRDAMDRERMERENARQLSLFLADRRPLPRSLGDAVRYVRAERSRSLSPRKRRHRPRAEAWGARRLRQIGRASCRERVEV